jgi:hypothetical protein
VVRYKGPDGVAFESSTECNCIMRMIHLVQDKSPVEVASEYSNECLIPIRDGKFLYYLSNDYIFKDSFLGICVMPELSKRVTLVVCIQSKC